MYVFSWRFLVAQAVQFISESARVEFGHIWAFWEIQTLKQLKYTVSQKNWATFFTAYNFRNIEQIFTKFGTNQSLFILNIVPEFI